MNKICIQQINIDNKYSIDAFFIDGKPLYEYLENSYRSFYNSEPKKPLAPMRTLAVAWTDDYDFEGDSDFVKFLLKLDHVNLPILSCPDDMDFSCTVLVAEVIKNQNSVLWKRIGIVNQSDWSFNIEKAHGILFLEAYTDDDWDKYGDNIALAEIDSSEWCDWISKNWREELYRRRVNYTYPEYQKDKNIDWFFECNWVFDKDEYDSVVQKCYDKTMIFEKLKYIEKTIEGNEYFENGVAYYFSVDELDISVSLQSSVKQHLLQIEAIDPAENITLTLIDDPQNDIKTLCDEWHFDKSVISEIQNIIDGTTKVYKCCEDYEYISIGNISDIFRIIVMKQETVFLEFSIVD